MSLLFITIYDSIGLFIITTMHFYVLSDLLLSYPEYSSVE